MNTYDLNPLSDIMESAMDRILNIKQELKDQRAAKDEQHIVSMLETNNYHLDSQDNYECTFIIDMNDDCCNVINVDLSVMHLGYSENSPADYGTEKINKGNSVTINQIIIEDCYGNQPYGYPITNDAIVEAIEKEVYRIYESYELI